MSVIVWTDTASGLSAYTTGGTTVTTSLTTVNFAAVEIIAPGGNLTIPIQFHISRSGANFTYKIMVESYDKTTGTTTGSVTELPASVSLATTNNQDYTANTTHTHATDHDHGSFTSGNMVSGAGGVALDAVGSKDILAHNHAIDIPNFTPGTSGAGGSHTHTWNEIYQHQHSVTNTSTNSTLVELANGTTLGSVQLNYIAVGT